jgi:tripartite-type tricarboxylate transporter receptor subunit TctC
MTYRTGLRATLAAAVTASAALLATSPQAQPAGEFYKGRTVTFLIGYSAGGGYDTYARHVARHMGKHLPGGTAQVVPRNMPGGGGRIAAAYMANVAPKDGTFLCTADQSLPLQQAMSDPSIKFDNAKFAWIGNPNASNNVTVVWHTTGIKTFDDAKRIEVAIGATGNNTSAQYPIVMNAVLGTRFKVIMGYPGGNDINLAMERGEVAGRGSNNWVSWKATRPHWLAEKKIVVLTQIGIKKEPDLPNIPLLTELATNEEDRALLALLSAPVAIGRPIFSTPDVPADRVAALRAAFDATMKDPEFLEEAKKIDLDIDPVSGADLEKVVREVIAAPKPVAERLARIISSIEEKK